MIKKMSNLPFFSSTKNRSINSTSRSQTILSIRTIQNNNAVIPKVSFSFTQYYWIKIKIFILYLLSQLKIYIIKLITIKFYNKLYI